MLTEPDENRTGEAAPHPPGATSAAPGTRHSTLPALPYMADTAQFGALVHQQLAESRRWSVPLAVLYIAVDRIHLLHDRHAVDIKTQLLQEAGQRLRARVRSSDQVVRVGREAFGVVLHDAAEATARNVEMRLTQALQMPFRIGAMLLHLGTHTGFAVYPQGGATGEALVLAAERAGGAARGG